MPGFHIAKYQLVQSLSEKIQTNLASFVEIEAELANETLPDDPEAETDHE